MLNRVAKVSDGYSGGESKLAREPGKHLGYVASPARGSLKSQN